MTIPFQVPLEVLQHLTENKRIYSIIVENYPNLLQYRSVSDKGLNMLPSTETTNVGTRVPIKFSMKLKKEMPEPSKMDELENDVFMDDADLKTLEGDIYKSHGMHPTKTLSAKKKNAIQHHAYLRNMRFRKSSMCYKGALLNIHKYKLKASSCPDIFRNSMAIFPKYEETVSTVSLMLCICFHFVQLL